MRDYAIRVERDDRAELRRLLNKLNIIDVIGGDVVARGGGAWDEIGTIVDWRTADAEGNGPLLVGPGGLPYWHYNLRTPFNLRARIRNNMNDPDIAALAGELGRFFSRTGANPDTGENEDILTAEKPRRTWL